MQSVTVDLDGPLHYADFGGRGPAMVLVHGLGGSHLNWLRLGPVLSERFRVLAPDLAGFGYTPPAGRPTTVQANRGLLDRFLAEIADGPAILVGNSMGGLVSLLETAAHPERVAGMVLLDAALPRPPGARMDPVVLGAFGAYMIPGVGESFVRRRWRSLGPEGLVRETFKLCCVDPGRIPPDVIEAHVGMARWRGEQTWAQPAFLEAARSMVRLLLRRRALEGIVRAVSVPALLVHGVADRLVSIDAARAVARLRPDWSFVRLAGTGHTPHLEAPQRVVEAMAGWLEGRGHQAMAPRVSAERV